MSWRLFALVALAAIGLHRLWNHEKIFVPLRTRLGRWLMPAACGACNAFWIGLGTIAGGIYAPFLLWPFALYTLVRGAAGVQAFVQQIPAMLHPQAPMPAPMTPEPPSVEERAANKITELQERHAEALSWDKRVILLTALHNFDPSYSITTAMTDQAIRIADENPRWLVEIWVLQTCDLKNAPPLPSNARIQKIMPAVPCQPDQHDQRAVDLVLGTLRRELMKIGNATIITHDLLFVAHFINHAAAIHAFGALPGFKWLHVAHSAPGLRPSLADDDARQFRYTLPRGDHRLIALAPDLTDRLLAYYGETDPTKVVCWPNVRTPMLWPVPAPARLRRFVRDQRIMEAAVVQLYPVSSTRFDAKGVGKLIRLFARLHQELHQAGRDCTVRLVIANPHANGKEGQQAIVKARQQSTEYGLPAECLVFTSETLPEYEQPGLPAVWIDLLFRMSNLFAFPTISEASPLIVQEAALANCTLVLNQSVPVLKTLFPEAWTLEWGTDPEVDTSEPGAARFILAELDESHRTGLLTRAGLMQREITIRQAMASTLA